MKKIVSFMSKKANKVTSTNYLPKFLMLGLMLLMFNKYAYLLNSVVIHKLPDPKVPNKESDDLKSAYSNTYLHPHPVRRPYSNLTCKAENFIHVYSSNQANKNVPLIDFELPVDTIFSQISQPTSNKSDKPVYSNLTCDVINLISNSKISSNRGTEMVFDHSIAFNYKTHKAPMSSLFDMPSFSNLTCKAEPFLSIESSNNQNQVVPFTIVESSNDKDQLELPMSHKSDKPTYSNLTCEIVNLISFRKFTSNIEDVEVVELIAPYNFDEQIRPNEHITNVSDSEILSKFIHRIDFNDSIKQEAISRPHSFTEEPEILSCILIFCLESLNSLLVLFNMVSPKVRAREEIENNHVIDLEKRSNQLLRLSDHYLAIKDKSDFDLSENHRLWTLLTFICVETCIKTVANDNELNILEETIESLQTNSIPMDNSPFGKLMQQHENNIKELRNTTTKLARLEEVAPNSAPSPYSNNGTPLPFGSPLSPLFNSKITIDLSPIHRILDNTEISTIDKLNNLREELEECLNKFPDHMSPQQLFKEGDTAAPLVIYRRDTNYYGLNFNGDSRNIFQHFTTTDRNLSLDESNQMLSSNIDIFRQLCRNYLNIGTEKINSQRSKMDTLLKKKTNFALLLKNNLNTKNAKLSEKLESNQGSFIIPTEQSLSPLRHSVFRFPLSPFFLANNYFSSPKVQLETLLEIIENEDFLLDIKLDIFKDEFEKLSPNIAGPTANEGSMVEID
jgi:hypothetical protein